MRLQWLLALGNLICQMGIATTGVTVRVTASGLGCETWPQCHPGSFTPVPGTEETLHQFIEFGNRLLTFVLVAFAAALLLALLRTGRRRELVVLGALMPGGVVIQGIIGGITVLTGLVWWTVALHLLATMLLTWLAAILFVRVSEADDAPRQHVVPTPLRVLAGVSAVAMAFVLVTGTLVTGAGPHAGDDRITPDERLQIPIMTLMHTHTQSLVAYLALVVGLLLGVLAVRARGPLLRRLLMLIAVIAVQALVGITQFWTGVPEALVVLHVTLATVLTAITAAVYAACVIREKSVRADGRLGRGGPAADTGGDADDDAAAPVDSAVN